MMTAMERADASTEVRRIRLEIARLKREIAEVADVAYGDEQDSLAYDSLRFVLWPRLDALRDRRDELAERLQGGA